MALTVINEGDTAYLTVTFKDKTGALAVPVTVTWQCIDLDSGAEMQAETSVSPGSSIEITIPVAANAMVDPAKAHETRRVIVKSTYGGSEAKNGQYDYRIRNLSRVG